MVTSTMFGRVLDYTTRQRVEFVNLTETVEQLIGEAAYMTASQ